MAAAVAAVAVLDLKTGEHQEDQAVEQEVIEDLIVKYLDMDIIHLLLLLFFRHYHYHPRIL
jgi:hypothetical protein